MKQLFLKQRVRLFIDELYITIYGCVCLWFGSHFPRQKHL